MLFLLDFCEKSIICTFRVRCELNKYVRGETNPQYSLPVGITNRRTGALAPEDSDPLSLRLVIGARDETNLQHLLGINRKFSPYSESTNNGFLTKS